MYFGLKELFHNDGRKPRVVVLAVPAERMPPVPTAATRAPVVLPA